MNRYRIQVGTKAAARLDFEVMAHSSAEVFMKHMELAEVGERVQIKALDPLDAQREQLMDAMFEREQRHG